MMQTNVLSQEALQEILRSGSLDEVEKLTINPKCFKFPYGRNALYYAARNPHVEVIEYLIFRLGIDPNSETENGITPLMRAAFYGNLPVIKCLIEIGVDPYKKNIIGQNIIGILMMKNYYNLVDTVKKWIEIYYNSDKQLKMNNNGLVLRKSQI